VGRVISAHGFRGEVKLRYYNEAQSAFYRYASFFVEQDNHKRELKPAQVRFQNGFFFITFEGLESLEETGFLLNQELFVREEDLPRLDENEYYDYQLIGLDVLNEHNVRIGTVKEIMHTAAQDILIVTGEKELLVPMVEEYVLHVDIAGSFMQVKENGLSI